MVIEAPFHEQPAQSLFCRGAAMRDDRPAIALDVKEHFAARFAPDFAAALTEHCHPENKIAAKAA